MIWLRRGVVLLLSLVFFVALLGSVMATSTNLILSKPDKLETWLAESKLYDHFVSSMIDQGKKSSDEDIQNNSNPGGGQLNEKISFDNPAVKKAADQAFSPQLLQKNVNVFLESNYDWLQGKTPAPNFVIDFTAAKQSFAQKVGKAVETHLASLQLCTPAQLSQIPNFQDADPFSLPCRPGAINPQTEGQKATEKVAQAGFLEQTVINANTINPDPNDPGKEPYYKKLEKAPDFYQLAVKAPWIFAAVVLLSALGIFFIALTRRKGARRIAIILTLVGLLLVITKFVGDSVFTNLEKRVFNNDDVGPLQQSLTNFAHRVESELVKVDLVFGIIFLLIAIVIFVKLYKSRSRTSKVTEVKAPKAPAPDDTGAGKPAATDIQLKPRPSTVIDVAGPSLTKPKPKPLSVSPAKPKPARPKPKKPRLIQ